jgi:hypothetical protein
MVVPESKNSLSSPWVGIWQAAFNGMPKGLFSVVLVADGELLASVSTA